MIAPEIKKQIQDVAKVKCTPFYFFDLNTMIDRIDLQNKLWKKHFPNYTRAYSFKTNSLPYITGLFLNFGFSAEAVSGNEIIFALENGYAPEKIYFDGPLKLREELQLALSKNINIQIDSIDELHAVLKLSKEMSVQPNISFRLSTIYKDNKLSRFGMTIDEYCKAKRNLDKTPYHLKGFHLHSGSNLASPDLIIASLKKYKNIIIDNLEKKHDFWINIGGGIPARSCQNRYNYITEDHFPNEIALYLKDIGIDITNLNLIIEPGRCLVEDFGFLVSSVEIIKNRNKNIIVVLDAGVHLVRSLYAWHHEVEIIGVKKCDSTKGRKTYTLYGFNCFESDIFAEGITFNKDITRGDLVIVSSSGGYDIPSSNQWIRPLPAVFGMYKDKIITIREPLTHKDMNRNCKPYSCI
ncbi:MAG: hypothetical protein PVI90_18375 [Desulfobacteraceae bacterium]